LIFLLLFLSRKKVNNTLSFKKHPKASFRTHRFTHSA